MKTNKKLHSVTLASAALILFLIIVSSTASAATAQSASSAGTYAYISNYNSNTVSVVDTATNTVTATAPVGINPLGVAVNPKGTKVYVANTGSNTVSVIDTATNTVIATVPVGSYSQGVAVNPAGTKVYVANGGSNTVSVIDTATNTVMATVPVSPGPCGVAVNPEGTKVYVTNWDSESVSVIDTTTDEVTATVPVGINPFGVAVNPTGTKVYVTNYGSNTISVINTTTDEVTATVPVGGYVRGVAVNPTGTMVYVANWIGYDVLSVIDTETNTVIASVAVGSAPWGVAVNPDGTKVYVTNLWSGNVAVIDTATDTITATVSVGSYPGAFGQFIGTIPVPEPILPVANFSSNVTSGYAPLTVQFTDLSENATGWNWNFGDGANSTDQSPTHTFSTEGNYTVNLTVSNENGTDSKLDTINVSQPVLPVATFSAKPTSGKAPLNVSFTDNSTGTPTAWKWTFGDGSNSTIQNPTHKYSKAGNYTVALTATNDAGSNTKTKTNYIKVTAVIKPVANFTSNVTSGKVPVTVAFTDKSTGTPTAWKWTFGDGTNSTVKNPTHKYSQEGNYTVKLTATNAAGSNTTTKTNYIKVTTNTRPGIYSKSK